MIDYKQNMLDVFRIVATLQVFLGHIVVHYQLGSNIESVVYFIRGVPILFVLCGFLAAMSIEKHAPKDWLIRRAVRILPAFWFCIIVNTLIIFTIYPNKPSLTEGLVYLATQFGGLNFYTGDWLRGYGVGTPNGVLWTISVQVQFYLVAPLIHKFLCDKSLKQWIIIIAVMLLFSIAINNFQGLMPSILYKLICATCLPYAYFLLLGMLGWYKRDVVVAWARKYRYCLAVVYAIWKICEIAFSFPHIFDGVLYNTVTTVLISLVVLGFGFCGKMRAKIDFTYGFFLYHMVIVNAAFQLGFTTMDFTIGGLFLFLGIFFFSSCAAAFSTLLIEKPSSRYLLQGVEK